MTEPEVVTPETRQVLEKNKTIPTLIAINTTFGSITYSNLGKPYPGMHMRNMATIPSLICCLNVGA